MNVVGMNCSHAFKLFTSKKNKKLKHLIKCILQPSCVNKIMKMHAALQVISVSTIRHT